jgi:hypothetical protein
MTDLKPEEKIEEIVKKVETESKPVYKRDAKKTLRQIAFEGRTRANKAKEEIVKLEPKEEPIVKEEKAPSEEKAPKLKKEEKKEEPIDIEKIKKETAEAAVAATRAEFEAKAKAIMDKEASDLEKQKEADELISVWDKEKRLPKDYKEIVTETHRLAEVKMKQVLRERDEKAKADIEATKKAEDDKKTAAQRDYQTRVDAINKRVKDELEELKTAKILEKDDERDEMLKFGIELNTKRTKDGKPPIDSITKLYFLHYKPYLEAKGKKSEQPAGADAPISGARTVASKSTSDGYVYARDHGKSYRQLLIEKQQRSKKI